MTARGRWDQTVLRALVVQAFDLRESPYFIDGCQEIVDAHGRLPLALLEHRQERNERLIRLLRETDPARIASRAAA